MKLGDAAQELGVSTRSLYRLVAEGLLKVHLERVSRPVLAYHINEEYLKRIKARLAAAEQHNGRVSTLRVVLMQIHKEGM